LPQQILPIHQLMGYLAANDKRVAANTARERPAATPGGVGGKEKRILMQQPRLAVVAVQEHLVKDEAVGFLSLAPQDHQYNNLELVQ
jgi:hypothetical protein